MKMAIKRLVAAAALSLAALPALPQDRSGAKVIVPADSALSKIDRQELARVFLGKKTIWESGQRIQPVMLPEESRAMQGFLDKTLQKSVEQYRSYWTRLLFSGGGSAPRTFRTSAQVVDFVSREPGAIGIVDAATATEHVKVVEVTN
jgi:ABC-type phosphate transport system substrate-binding protein